MSTEPSAYDIHLIRAELKAAMAEMMVQLVDRFAAKGELEQVQRLFVLHEEADQTRFSLVDEKLNKTLSFQNRLAGALALCAVLIPFAAVGLSHLLN